MKTKVIRMIGILLSLITLGLISCTTEDVAREQVDYTGEWTGTYSGAEQGTWSVVINNNNIVIGTASDGTGETYDVEGVVDVNGNFFATVGGADSGATWSGNISNNNVSGTWTNLSYNMNGNFFGQKQ